MLLLFGGIGVIFLRRRLLVVEQRQQRLEQTGHAFAMLGADRDRLAEPERVAFHDAVVARTPLGLVGDQHDRHVLRA